jgi:hypothetical protein
MNNFKSGIIQYATIIHNRDEAIINKFADSERVKKMIPEEIDLGHSRRENLSDNKDHNVFLTDLKKAQELFQKTDNRRKKVGM